MDEILLLLLRKGAHKKPLRITTGELGSLCGMSQQNASGRLISLERDGLIERSKDGIMLSRKGYSEMAAGYAALKNAFEGGKLEIEGTITTGLGEGGYYVSMAGYRKEIRERLGFEPFPGTLNLRIEGEALVRRQRLLDSEPVIIPGFRDQKRTYGDILAYRCRMEGEECALIVPVRTHHGPEIVELISPVNLKKKLGRKDGEKVKVSIC